MWRTFSQPELLKGHIAKSAFTHSCQSTSLFLNSEPHRPTAYYSYYYSYLSMEEIVRVILLNGHQWRKKKFLDGEKFCLYRAHFPLFPFTTVWADTFIKLIVFHASLLLWYGDGTHKQTVIVYCTCRSESFFLTKQAVRLTVRIAKPPWVAHPALTRWLQYHASHAGGSVVFI